VKLKAADVVIRAHRRTLTGVEELAARLGRFSGPAVAYEPGTGYVLLAGERRFAAHVRRGDIEVEFYVLKNWTEFVAWMMHDRSLQETRGFKSVPLNPIEAGYFDAKAQELLKPLRGEKPSFDLAEYLQFPEAQVSTSRALIRAFVAAEDPERRAAVLSIMRDIEAGVITSHAGWDRWIRYRKRAEAPVRTAAEQRKTLAGAGTVTQGLADALGGLGEEINADLTREELERHIAALLVGQGALVKTLKKLRTAAGIRGEKT
jgi:hypothetical protein